MHMNILPFSLGGLWLNDGDEMIVSDPCYLIGGNKKGSVSSAVKPGEWNIFLYVEYGPEYGGCQPVALVASQNKTPIEEFEQFIKGKSFHVNGNPQKMGSLAVDSGQLGFFTSTAAAALDDKVYDQITVITNGSLGAGRVLDFDVEDDAVAAVCFNGYTISQGFVSQTYAGDGDHDFYSLIGEDGEIEMVILDLFGFEENEDSLPWDDDDYEDDFDPDDQPDRDDYDSTNPFNTLARDENTPNTGVEYDDDL